MYKIYQVNDNETISDIARKFNTTEDELRKINGFQNNVGITTGQYIIVPMNGNILFDQYKIVKGDTLYSIARKHQVSVAGLLKLNGLNENEFIYPGETILVPKDGVDFYITEEEDTLDQLVQKFNRSINDIMDQNRSIKLKPEQLIVIKREEII